jgi:PAS domain S-box-containing protein
MKKGNDILNKNKLRRCAEKALEENPGRDKDLSAFSSDAMEGILHDLQVHQIELEMQNEELRNAQLELEKARDKYLDLYDLAPVGYFTIDDKWMIREVNLAGSLLLGVERQYLIHKTFFLFISPEFKDTFYLHCKDTLKTGIRQKCELKLRRKDGAGVYVQMESLPVRDDKDTVVFLRTIVTAINDLKQTGEALRLTWNELILKEEKHKAIFRSVPDGIITIGRDMSVMEANEAVQKVCGLNPEEIMGCIYTAVPKKCGKACEVVLLKTMETQTPVKSYRIECRHPEKPDKLALISSTPLLDTEHRFQGVVLVIQDITAASEREKEWAKKYRFHKIIGQSEKMQEIYKLIHLLAVTATTLLISGESGVGKDMVTDAVHSTGDRAHMPLIKVNCSALSENLLESELFGHVKGAFTGAMADKTGRFQAAEGGTILLDEIGDISPAVQSKLLRVLQAKEFERVGSSETLKADIRIIATTNKNLIDKVKLGEFREDLYYRLKVVEITLPPLRERRDDILLLADHFRQFFNKRFNRQVDGISEEMKILLTRYHWPGNIRELEHAVEHAFILCNGSTLTVDCLPSEIRKWSFGKTEMMASPSSSDDEKASILRSLSACGWNKAKAARLLGIDRKTLYRKIKIFGIAEEKT